MKNLVANIISPVIASGVTVSVGLTYDKSTDAYNAVRELFENGTAESLVFTTVLTNATINSASESEAFIEGTFASSSVSAGGDASVDVQDQVDALKAQIEALKEEKAELVASNETLTQENTELKGEIEELTAPEK